MPSNHLILCLPLLPPSIFPSIRVFSNESVLRIRWPKYWSFSFSISLSRFSSLFFRAFSSKAGDRSRKAEVRTFSGKKRSKRASFPVSLALSRTRMAMCLPIARWVGEGVAGEDLGWLWWSWESESNLRKPGGKSHSLVLGIDCLPETSLPAVHLELSDTN